MKMLKLLVTTAVLLALATKFADSAATDVTDVIHINGQAHVLMKVSCSSKWQEWH